MSEFLTIDEASKWASKRTGREVTPANLSYLINYGRIRKEKNGDGKVVIRVGELQAYYASWKKRRKASFMQRLGDDLNWRLSFEEYKESETTKHVHRLHPYKGKFIPQLVEYFLDSHTDEFKTEAVFSPGDVILDPFCGSGTTLVQANELGMHAIGVDTSRFNAQITNLKLCRLPPPEVAKAAELIQGEIYREPAGMRARGFEVSLLDELKKFNDRHFPSSEYKRLVRLGEINEKEYGREKAKLFLPKYRACLERFNMQDINPPGGGFMDTWYFLCTRAEINAAADYIQKMGDPQLRGLMRLILSRTVRSCRATTHSDLATLRSPVLETYYCGKHGKICKPVFSILGWWRRYAQDTVKRLAQFASLRTDTEQACLVGDSRAIDLSAKLKRGALAEATARRRVRGIFSSPPYVGLINYHEQHAYAYELFDLKRNEQNEIGILEKGANAAARKEYVKGVADVLTNCRRFMVNNFDVFLVANDKFGLYPQIAEHAGMRIVAEYKRPVLNRAEGAKNAYGEIIFHMKNKNMT